VPDSNLICGFLKIRHGILRNDLYRCILNMEQYCDEIFACDDASVDGTYEFLVNYLGEDRVIKVPLEEHNFEKEMYWKQELLQLVHKYGPWQYIWWLDSDEVLDTEGTQNLRQFCLDNLTTAYHAWTFKYIQLWRNTSWARTDSDFDKGNFIKLWKYHPSLCFDTMAGTHHAQFPQQVFQYLEAGKVAQAPFKCLHYGNVGENLKFKILQYYGGLGGVDRHLLFDQATYEQVPQVIFPERSDILPGERPEPFTPRQVELLLQMKNLTRLDKTFCVIIPTYNRADTLPRALDSLIRQSYDKWICMVLDDGSTDNTSEVLYDYCNRDPRIFYCRYLEHRGGVAMNALGMDIAVETASWWSRLGSDDWFFMDKLKHDAAAFEAGHRAVYNPFVVHRTGVFGEMGNLPVRHELHLPMYLQGGFSASWAGISVDCSILKAIKKKYGNYVDPQLRNMEDCLFNFRVLKETKFVWRGLVDDKLIIDPDNRLVDMLINGKPHMIAESVWNVNQVGASADGEVYGRDRTLTTEIILAQKDL